VRLKATSDSFLYQCWNRNSNGFVILILVFGFGINVKMVKYSFRMGFKME
jgi:hypothetical protein